MDCYRLVLFFAGNNQKRSKKKMKNKKMKNKNMKKNSILFGRNKNMKNKKMKNSILFQYSRTTTYNRAQ